MREIEQETLIWDHRKRTFVRKMYTVLVAEDATESQALRRAAERTGIATADLDYAGQHASSEELTRSGVEKVKEALENPGPTPQEIQDKRTFCRFLDRLSSGDE